MTFRKIVLVTSVTLALSSFQGAQAHTSFVIDPSSIPFAGKSYTGTLRAGHGCSDPLNADLHFDTDRIEVEIPNGVTRVKPFDAPWGKATIQKNDAGLVTKLIWTRSDAALPADTHLYLVTFRATLPDAPLTNITFRTVQYCTNNGTTPPTSIEAPWEGADIPTLKLVPPRLPGWNKYTISTAVADIDALKMYFSDAQIVWSGGSAWSVNPVTDALITNKLTAIPANQEFWVKY